MEQPNYKILAEEALIRLKATKEQLKIILKDLEKHTNKIENEK